MNDHGLKTLLINRATFIFSLAKSVVQAPPATAPPATPDKCDVVQGGAKFIKVRNCTSNVAKPVTSCRGHCNSEVFALPGSSMFSPCTCCRPKTTRKERLTFFCGDGTEFDEDFYIIESCGCQEMKCTALPDTSGTTTIDENNLEAKQRRRRRRR